MNVIKFTESFFENEWWSLLEYFPELRNRQDNLFKVLATRDLNIDPHELEPTVKGIISIQSLRDGAIFNIDELAKLPDEERPQHGWWCFVHDSAPNEYEVIS